MKGENTHRFFVIATILALTIRECNSFKLMKPVRYQLDISRTQLNAATFTLGNAGDSGTTSLAQPIDPGPSIKIKGKTLNLWGILYALTTFSVASVVFPFMVVLAGFCDLFGNKKQRRILDWIVHFWANTVMRFSFCNPTIYGIENLPPPGETVVYVPNHTSFIDILMMSAFVPRPFKYLSKSEIKDIPIIGWSMALAQHVFLKRDDLQSTLAVTDQCVQRLRDGNSMVLFAEGTRSLDGTLKTFKKGAFQMAKAAGVRVVPVSIGNLHRLMPRWALLPLAPLTNTYIKIHPPIDTKELPVSKIRALCHEAVNSGLPAYQKQLPPAPPSSPPSLPSTPPTPTSAE